MSDYGLLDVGFVIKSLTELQTEIAADLTTAFGDIRTDASSVFGNISAIFSKHLEDLWELAQEIFNAKSIAATGIALDDVVGWVGITRIPDMPSHVDVSVTGTVGTTIAAGTIVRDEDTGKQFALLEDTVIGGTGTTVMDFECLENGPIAALAGKVTQIVTPAIGLASVTNANNAILGRRQETDAELRTRFQSARSVLGYARFDAIVSRVQSEVAEVVSCSIFENTTGITDPVTGLPPHSFEVVVDCPTAKEQLVANKIWECKPVGIATYGNANSGNGYSVSDSQGYLHTIKFSKVVYEYVYALVALTLSDEISFPADGYDQVAAAIKAYGDTLGLGNDVIIQALHGPIFSIPGVKSATIQLAKSTVYNDPSPSYDTIDLDISTSQLAKFLIGNIHVS